MAAVRADVRRTERLPLPSDLGPAEISEIAVAVVLRFAADSVVGVRARSCRIELAPGDFGAVQVRMSVSLRYGTAPAGEVFDRIRERIATADPSRPPSLGSGSPPPRRTPRAPPLA